jgi:hypothetical protein
MSSAAPFVTLGSTPLCDACHEYYSERHCTDCDQHQCTWCNLSIHQPIGKRNHWRPRLYGEDPHAELERNATASADLAVERATRGVKQNQQATTQASGSAGGGAGSSSGGGKDARGGDEEGVHNKYTFDATTGRVNVTTEFQLPLTAEEGWDVLGDWDAPYLPFPCDVSGDRRVLVLPRDAENEEEEEDEQQARQRKGKGGIKDTIVVTERLIQRSDREMFYSYSRTTPPDGPEATAFPYTDLLSKFAFLPVSSGGGGGGGGGKQCLLQWTTSVLPRDPKRPRRAAEAVARFQESWRPYFDAALQDED